MSDGITFFKEDDGKEGRYVARFAGTVEEGEITYTHVAPGVISANHTGVPVALRGRGIAKQLLDYMLEDATRSGFRILPVCPFIAAEYARHPEWSDLFVTRPGEEI